MDTDRKVPTPVYQPYLGSLAIPDLQDAQRSGAFDLGVLLFLQDGYMQRTLAEQGEPLREAFAQIDAGSEDLDERAAAKREALTRAMCELYVRLKEEGDETTGVRGYAGAAGVYLNGAIVDYRTYLLDVAAHLEQSIQVESTPDLAWLAGHTYALLARASTTVDTIEGALGADAGARAGEVLSTGIGAIGSPGQNSVALALGVRMWRMIEQIDAAPQNHVVNREGDVSAELDAEIDPWDFEPASRADFDL
ncbi:hypothetical protein [Castellaniella sp.]|uniref:hypothetical protein n=1 Tax=Castellaniella sp. TaxID=1955812 RepID=UPI002AFF95C6|nr:hypothetical protein [Castellaniella sp.]